MKPQRMCMVCRMRGEKELFLRIVRNKKGEISLDSLGTMPGRGAYLCKNADCISQAEKRKALERAFSCKVEKDVYRMIQEVAEVQEDDA